MHLAIAYRPIAEHGTEGQYRFNRVAQNCLQWGARDERLFGPLPRQRFKWFWKTIQARVHVATITNIPEGVGAGSARRDRVTLARTNAIGGTNVFPAEIAIPPKVDRSKLRPGVSGNATVFAKDAGVIGIIAGILLWV